MPLPQRWSNNNNRKGGNKRRKPPPEGFDYVETILEALEQELRDVVQERDPTKRKTEALWPIHQLNWQKSRYIYDLYYIHHRISKSVYQYCLDQKWVDAGLMAKWKKPGYERLCSTYVINPMHYKFGSTSICRVPYKDRSPEQLGVQDPTTGCLGCFSGRGGPRNIFGNKYGQHLAAIQIAREERAVQKERQQRQAVERQELQQQQEALIKQQQEALQAQDDNDLDDEDDEVGPFVAPPTKPSTTEPENQHNDEDGNAPTDDDDDAETDDDDDDDEDDFGPSPAAGIWAGSQKLERQSERITYPEQEEEQSEEQPEEQLENEHYDDDDKNNKNNNNERPAKLARTT